MANFTRRGYGQVEPNQLSAQKTGQIYASLPLDKKVEVLQNGEFMYYDYKSGQVAAEGVGEPMLVFNEVKLYRGNLDHYADFAMIRVGDNYVTSNLVTAGYDGGALTVGKEITPSHASAPYRADGIAPRMLKTNVGDIMTTNMVKTGVEYQAGKFLQPKKDNKTNTMVLELVNTSGDALPEKGMAWVIAKVTTMPDGQPGLKIQRVQ